MESLVAQKVKSPPAMQETWVWSLGQADALQKGTATHSSIFAWRFPRTEEPGGLQYMESQRAGHDWESNTLSIKCRGWLGWTSNSVQAYPITRSYISYISPSYISYISPSYISYILPSYISTCVHTHVHIHTHRDAQSDWYTSSSQSWYLWKAMDCVPDSDTSLLLLLGLEKD